MTMQCCDYVWYNGIRYTLVDIENGKSLISAADFAVEGYVCCTDCYRGYTAEYFIENGVIYGKKTVEHYPAGERLTELNTSERMRMHYTGSLVIAANKSGHFPAQDITDFLYSDRALELTFDDGRLTETLDLTPAAQAWKSSRRAAADWEQEYAQREEAARAALSHEYGTNYKWGG